MASKRCAAVLCLLGVLACEAEPPAHEEPAPEKPAKQTDLDVTLPVTQDF